jgi:plasmid stabilization system protein ParE
MLYHKVLLSDDAERDIDSTFVWYEIQKVGLGLDFIVSLNTGINRIKRNPFQYPVVFKEIRRHLLTKFPYCIYYFTEKEKTVKAIAVLHTGRNPQVWKRRKRRTR